MRDTPGQSGEGGVYPDGVSLQPAVSDRVRALVATLRDELVAVRRDLHAHPEVGFTEVRTTRVVAERLRMAGLEPRLLPGTGLVVDIGDPGVAADGSPRGRLALRADIDALPLTDTCGQEYCSTVDGVAHACGHDVHATVVLGAALVLAELDADELLGRGVRCIFQPAEEIMTGGAPDVIAAGALEGVDEIFALHCDPKVDVGTVGTRIGPITAAADQISVTLSSTGGHTSRPHLTGDLVFALSQVVTQVPAILGRRLDPRSGTNLTWGAVHAGDAHNAIPTVGVARGTLRCLDARAWERAARILEESVGQVVAPYDVTAEIHHTRGVPPVDNDEAATGRLEEAARDVLGPRSVMLTEQSLGGEDFAWYLTHVPGALARLGTRTPGGRTYDIHQGDLQVDERAIEVGVALLARVAAGR